MISFLNKHLSKLYFPIGWTLVIAFLLCIPGSMIPSEPLFPIPEFDKIVHISLFGGFVFLWNLFFSKRGFSTRKMLCIFFFVFVLANSYGIGMEYIQKYYIPMRDFSEGDIIADMMGAGLGYGISNIFLLKKS
jgi:VanZ family protein